MRKMNKKGFTLVELLAVIVVLAIIMMIAVTSVTSILDKSRRSAFFTTASSFVDAVRNNAIMNSTLPSCGSTDTVYLSTAMLEKGGKESPYGNDYSYCSATNIAAGTCSTTHSFVKIEAGALTNGSCTYTYKVFLSDGSYAIGTNASPVQATEMSSASVTKITS